MFFCNLILSIIKILGLTDISHACTGIRLQAEDGGVVYGRSMEWGTFDLHSRVTIIPRGYAFQGLTPDGLNGKKWVGKYGILGLDMLEKDSLADAMNEKGLAAGLFYHPGYAVYAGYDEAQADDTITAVDLIAYILSQFATVDEVKAGLEKTAIFTLWLVDLWRMRRGIF